MVVRTGTQQKSLTLNLKHPDGLAILKQLLADADILIENFRPGVLESSA